MRHFDRTVDGGRRPVQRTERWVDISNAPLAVGDLLKIYNEASEVKRTFYISQIEENAEGTSRAITAEVVDSTDPNELVGTKVDFVLPRAQPVLGTHIRMDERLQKLTHVEANDLMAVELYKWLMGRSASNYGAEFKKCVEFLRAGGLMPTGEDYKTAQNRLRTMMRQRADMFRSSGGKIFGTGIDLQGVLTGGKALDGRGNVLVIRRVKMSKVHAAIRLLLESGLLGEVILEE